MTNLSKKERASKHIIAPSPLGNYLLMGAGSMFTASVIAGFMVGYLLDYLFGTMPLFFLVCGVLGFIGGAQKIQLLTKRSNKPVAPSKKEEHDAE